MSPSLHPDAVDASPVPVRHRRSSSDDAIAGSSASTHGRVSCATESSSRSPVAMSIELPSTRATCLRHARDGRHDRLVGDILRDVDPGRRAAISPSARCRSVDGPPASSSAPELRTGDHPDDRAVRHPCSQRGRPRQRRPSASLPPSTTPASSSRTSRPPASSTPTAGVDNRGVMPEHPAVAVADLDRLEDAAQALASTHRPR